MRISKIYIFILLNIATLYSYSQQSVNSAGGDINGSGGSVAFSIGQVTYKSYTGSGITECQGVQKAYEFYNDVVKPADMGDLIISNYVSPNNDGQNDTWKINNLSSKH